MYVFSLVFLAKSMVGKCTAYLNYGKIKLLGYMKWQLYEMATICILTLVDGFHHFFFYVQDGCTAVLLRLSTLINMNHTSDFFFFF